MVGQLAAGHGVNGLGKEWGIIRQQVNGMVVLMKANQVLYIVYIVLTVGLVPAILPSLPSRPLAESSHHGNGRRSANPSLSLRSSGRLLLLNSYPGPLGYEGE